MRYLFSGLMRDTGQPVEGHIEANDVDIAYDMLSGHGVVASSVIPDPKPLNIHEELPDAPELADALESAMDSSSSQVNFDDIAEQYKGKKVWVIDRDKIRRRVAQVVDTAFHLATTSGENHTQTQERIRSALHGLFNDNRNLASERNASSVMGMKFNPDDANPRRPMSPPGSIRVNTPQSAVAGVPQMVPMGEVNIASSSPLEEQIKRLADVVSSAETVLATLRAAARGLGRGGSEGGGGRRQSKGRSAMNDEKNDVLLTIYKSNVELLKAYKEQNPASAVKAG